MNFAYAITVYGEQETKTLFEKNGIQYFSRYPQEILKAVLDKRNSGKKKFVGIFAYEDWNGAFQDNSFLEKLLPYFDIDVYETNSEKTVYKHAPKDGTLFISGHGFEKNIFLGDGTNEKSKIDLGDTKEMSALKKKPHTVILDSCSTGKTATGIGASISKSLSAKLFAPIKPGKMSRIKVVDGKIVDVEYSVPKKIFVNGKEVSATKER